MSDYFAWIPTLSGRLSFSVASTIHVGRVYDEQSEFPSGGRFFLAVNEWNASDFTFPFLSSTRKSRAFFERLFTGNETRFVFITAIVSSIDREYLVGRISILPYKNWKENKRKILHEINEISSKEDVDARTDFGDMDRFGAVFCSAAFSISRNGTTRINVDYLGALSLNSFRILGEDPNYCFSSIVYAFLRELLHTHKYHSPDSDTIISVYEKEWHSEVYTSLLRKIIVLRKMGDLDSLRKAEGILSYAQSFSETVMTSADKLRSAVNLVTLRHGLATDITLAIAANYVSVQKRISAWTRMAAASLVALIGYLRINYDLNASAFEDNAVDRMPGVNLTTAMTSLREKVVLIDIYFRYTDEIVILAVVLFIISSVVGLDYPYFRAASRDMLRYATVAPRRTLAACVVMSILALVGATYFIVQAF